MHLITLPELGDGIETATVAMWHVQVGDDVREDDDVVEVVTDKATFHVPAGCRGRVREIRAGAGCGVSVGQTLGTVEPLSGTSDASR